MTSIVATSGFHANTQHEIFSYVLYVTYINTLYMQFEKKRHMDMDWIYTRAVVWTFFIFLLLIEMWVPSTFYICLALRNVEKTTLNWRNGFKFVQRNKNFEKFTYNGEFQNKSDTGNGFLVPRNYIKNLTIQYQIRAKPLRKK